MPPANMVAVADIDSVLRRPIPDNPWPLQKEKKYMYMITNNPKYENFFVVSYQY